MNKKFTKKSLLILRFNKKKHLKHLKKRKYNLLLLLLSVKSQQKIKIYL